MSQGGKSRLWLRALIPVLAFVIIAAIPAPQGLSWNAWIFFALFIATIIGAILEPVPLSVVALTGLIIATVLRLVYTKPDDAIKWALSGYANTIPWIVVGAFVFGIALSKTGLGKRIALHLVRLVGKNTLGLGYSIALTDTVLAPFMASNTARGGGVVYPITAGIAEVFDSKPGPTARKIGAYLIWTAFAANTITSSLFYTGIASNPLALGIVKQTLNVDISWVEWFLGYLPVGIILLILAPLLAYLVFPPEIKKSPEAPRWASEELSKMGPISKKEIATLIILIMALSLWIAGESYIHSTATAILALVLLILTGVVSWDDILSNKSIWNTFVWLGALITLADGLNRVGFVSWLAKLLAAQVKGLPFMTVLLIFLTVFFWSHYLFASVSAHITAMLPIFLATLNQVSGGILPPKTLGMLLVLYTGSMGVMSPYGTGPAPIFYGSGYIESKDFWKLGFIFALVYFIAYCIIGVPWLMALLR